MTEKIENRKMETLAKADKKDDGRKKFMNQLFNSVWFIILLGILILGKTILFYCSTIAVNEELEIETILGTASFVVVIICMICLFPNRVRIIAGVVVDFVLSLLLFADHAYYIYSSSVLSIAQFTNLQYGEEILNTLPMILELKQILYFLDLILILIMLITKCIKIEKKGRSNRRAILYKSMIGAVGIIIFFYVSLKYVERGKDKTYNKDMQIKEATIFGYHVFDISNSINRVNHTKYKNYEDMVKSYDQLKGEYQDKYGQEKYSFEGILRDKNIIIIQLESVQEFVINKEINGKQITPNLNKFLNENIEFTNMHMQSYSTTADSEHSTITSIYPMENGMSFSKYYTNTYDDIFKMFHRENYYTSYMHGNDLNFWNRGNVYKRLEIDDLALKDKFEDTEYINGFLSDELLYTQGLERMKQYQTPYLSFIVSASSHTPYELEGLQDRNKVSIDVGKYKDTYFGNYLEAVNYADYAFGVFMEGLKELGVYDNTAILIFGDHNGLNMYNDEMLEFLESINPKLTDVEIKLNYTNVVCGLKIPGISHMKIEKPISKLDIKPTLTYLCGIEDGFSLGTNMFASKEFVSLNNGRIIGTRYYFDEEWYDRITGEVVNLENIDENIKNTLEQYYNYMKTELEISNSVSINNLLK